MRPAAIRRAFGQFDIILINCEIIELRPNSSGSLLQIDGLGDVVYCTGL